MCLLSFGYLMHLTIYRNLTTLTRTQVLPALEFKLIAEH